MVGDPFLFPRILYGDLETTRRAWQKIARRAWKAGEWDEALWDGAMVPYGELPGDMLLQRGFFGTGVRRKEQLWRLYWTSKSVDMAHRGPYTHEMVAPVARLFLSGMKHLWFTIGMLCAESGDLCPEPPLIEPNEPASDFALHHRRYLERFVNWLPEIQKLNGLFGTEAYTSAELPHRPVVWMSTMVSFACQSGYNIPLDSYKPHWIEYFRARYNYDLVAWFIDAGIIEQRADRFVLTDPSADLT